MEIILNLSQGESQLENSTKNEKFELKILGFKKKCVL